MKKNYFGLDVLRGFGVFTVLALHSAFYYFDDIYEVDFNNPPIVVTVIGLLLMFAGIFAMISGFVHTLSAIRKTDQQIPREHILKYGLVYGGITLIVAYGYFIFTGPGIIHFETKTMNNSILVQWIRTGSIVFTNAERVLYIDSLVMIGMNILLLAIFAYFVLNAVSREKRPQAYLFSAMVFMAFSLVRIPLYEVWQNAFDQGDAYLYLLLNPFVAKNNPIFPFLAFGLIGGWMATLAMVKDVRGISKRVLPIGLLLLSGGILLYVNLEDTMLERAIDLKWYSIMVAQLGLFMLILLAVIWRFDYSRMGKQGRVSIFFARFSKGGLTAFFLESVVSALIFRILLVLAPDLSFTITGALLYGLSLALFWGIILVFWEKAQYKYTLEYWIARVMNQVGRTQKSEKLKGI